MTSTEVSEHCAAVKLCFPLRKTARKTRNMTQRVYRMGFWLFATLDCKLCGYSFHPLLKFNAFVKYSSGKFWRRSSKKCLRNGSNAWRHVYIRKFEWINFFSNWSLQTLHGAATEKMTIRVCTEFIKTSKTMVNERNYNSVWKRSRR